MQSLPQSCTGTAVPSVVATSNSAASKLGVVVTLRRYLFRSRSAVSFARFLSLVFSDIVIHKRLPYKHTRRHACFLSAAYLAERNSVILRDKLTQQPQSVALGCWTLVSRRPMLICTPRRLCCIGLLPHSMPVPWLQLGGSVLSVFGTSYDLWPLRAASKSCA